MDKIPPNSRYREVPTPEDKYLDEEELKRRKEVYDAIYKTADEYNEVYLNTDNEDAKKRASKLYKAANRFNGCRRSYVLSKCMECNQHYVAAYRCESRICPHCSKIYASKIKQRILELLYSYNSKGKKRLSFLTLTLKMKDGQNPKLSDVKMFMKCVRKLINDLYPKKKGCGGIAILEIGKNLNIHMHAIVYGFYIPQTKISEKWDALTKGSKIVDIRSLRNAKQAVYYLIKYILKPPSFDSPEKYAVYFDCITGIRRIHTYGVFYGKKITLQESNPCPICGGKLEYIRADCGSTIPRDALFFNEIKDIREAA